MTFYRCPKDDIGPDPDTGLPPLLGCGQVFEQEEPDQERFVDCPHCGMFFEPRPQDIIDQPELPRNETAR